MKKVVMVVALLSALACGNAQAEEWTKDDFVRLWTVVRTAIAEGNLVKWKELTLPATGAPSKQMTAEEFTQAKDFMLDTYPDLNTVKFIKFDRKADQALFVLETYLDDENYITLDAFKFVLVGKTWKLSGNVGGVSFPKKDISGKPIDIELRIKKELAENGHLQLNSEQAPAN